METPEQKKVFDDFMRGSKTQEWSGAGRIKTVRAKVVLLLSDDVEFDVGGPQSVRGPRAMLLKTSQGRLEQLAKDARVVGVIRKDELLNESMLAP